MLRFIYLNFPESIADCEVPFAAKGQERQPRQRAQAEARWQRRSFRTALYYPHPLHLCIRSTFSHPHRACTRHELCTIIISYGNRVRSCLSVRRCESVESGRLMAADVWLVGPVGLILGSNGSFGDAWVSLLSLVGTELYRRPHGALLLMLGCCAKWTDPMRESVTDSALCWQALLSLPAARAAGAAAATAASTSALRARNAECSAARALSSHRAANRMSVSCVHRSPAR